MFIGNLSDARLSFKRIGRDIDVLPEVREGGIFAWRFGVLSDSGIDIHAHLGRLCYLGSVTLDFASPKTSVYSVEILTNGKIIGKYSAETGKLLHGGLTIPVCEYAEEIIIRVYTSTEEFVIFTPGLTVAYDDESKLLFPIPKEASYTGGSVKISEIITDESEDARFSGEFLKERLSERFGDVLSESGVKCCLKIDESYIGERFSISVTDTSILLTAGRRLSLLYAVCALLDIGREGEFPICEIDDAPTKEMRGVHIGLPKRENIEFVKRLFKYFLLPLRYNQVIVQFSGSVKYDSHPEIAEAYLEANLRAEAGLQPPFPHDYMASEGKLLEKQEVAGILDAARELGFEIIPEVQSLGHVQWLTYAHPELGERAEEDKVVTDTTDEDLRPENFYTHCYCPSNKKSYEIMFELLDEIIELARPERYVHMGHDEVYHLGLCEECKKLSHAELFAKDVNIYYDFLAKKGLKMAIWADMLQPITPYKTHEASALIPKDILMLDFIWYFHTGLDLEENLFDKGFDNLMIGNLYSSHFPRYKKRMMRDGIRGGQVSLWCRMNEEAMAEKGKFFDLMYTSEMLWNTEKYDDALRGIYTHIIVDRLQERLRDEVRGVYSPKGYRATEIKLPEGKNANIPSYISAEYPSAIVANGCEISVNRRADRLVLEHFTLEPGIRNVWTPMDIFGDYTVSYEDGGEVKIPLSYSGRAMWHKHSYGMPLAEPNHRHYGYAGTWQCDPAREFKSPLGESTLILGYIFENPYPEKKIISISYTEREGALTTLILAGVKSFNKIL